jgi:hypothetical protein
VPTRRIFDLVVITGIGVHLIVSTLVRPWARYRLVKAQSPVAHVAGEILVRAA